LEHILQEFWVSLQDYLRSTIPTDEAWNDAKAKASSAYLQIHQYYEAEAVERALPASDQTRHRLTLVTMGSTRPQDIIEWAHAEIKGIGLDAQAQKESNFTNLHDPFSDPSIRHMVCWVLHARMQISGVGTRKKGLAGEMGEGSER
jgi:hypothetical protein